jgi:hypothetical protein
LIEAFPENHDRFERFRRAPQPLRLVKVGPLQNFRQFAFNVGDMAGFQPEVKPEEANVKWRQTEALAMPLVVLLEDR